MRALNLFFTGLFALLLTGCAGYRLGPVNNLTPGDKTIQITPFNNQTFQPRLGDALTQSMRERIQTDGTFRLATHDTGDLIVTGVIHDYQRYALGYLSTDAATPEDYRVEATVHVTARDRISGKVVLDKDVKGHTLIHVGSDLASAERQAMPLLAQNLAQTITELLTEGSW